jgi:two-component system response regulator RegX3
VSAPRILIVDDEAALANATCEYFNLFGMDAFAVGSSREFWDAWQAGPEADVVLLDLNLPDGSGLQICSRLRAVSSVPILVTSVRGSDDDVLLALAAGADDHISKPYALSVLLAKTRAMLRRSGLQGNTAEPGDSVRLGNIEVRLDQGRVFGPDGEITLTGTEWRLLEYLARNPGRVIGKQELSWQVWGDNESGDGRLATHVRRLREKIEPAPESPRFLKTSWGTGYLLDLDGSR